MDDKTMELVRKIDCSTAYLVDLGKGLGIIYNQFLDSTPEDDISGQMALLNACQRDIQAWVDEIRCSVKDLFAKAKAA